MAGKKHEFATELIKSFEAQCRRQLTTADREFCDRLATQGINEMQIRAAIMSYVSKESRTRGLKMESATLQHTNMENYISVSRSLLLSYSPPKAGTALTLGKFYIPVPQSMDMTLVVIPQYSILLKVSKRSNEAWYGSKRDNAGVLFSIKVFKKEDDWRLICDGSYVDTQYPRFSISCQLSSKCRAYVETDLGFYVGGDATSSVVTECRMSPNRSKVCPMEIKSSRTYGLGLSDFLAIVLMCYSRWQKRPMSAGTRKQESYSGSGVALIARTPQWEHISEGFREVQLREYPDLARQMRAGGWNIDNRASPCEHERRGHMRTLKDGRVIYVRPSIVNKGGEKVVYRVSE